MTRKTIIFHDLVHARAALAAAQEHNPALAAARNHKPARGAEIILRSAPGAAVYAGVGYLKAIIEKAGADANGTGLEAMIDCGEDPGTALAALRAGWKLVMFSGRRDVLAKLAQIAERQGARVVEPDPDGAALNLLDAPDPLTACRVFLESDQ